jgi:class 3 adenylate cyclase
LLARVRSLLRIRALQRQVEAQAVELVEQRVARLRRFLSPKVVDLILDGQLDDPLATRRKEVTIMFVDLRGFTAFSETAPPEDVLELLRQYHAEVGRLVGKHDGTIEHFSGDGVMLIFNDPQTLPDPAISAVRMAVELRDGAAGMSRQWSKLGYTLGCGIGIAQGFATIGTIGFPGRQDYGVISPANNLASRLCARAEPGSVLVSQRVYGRVEDRVEAEPVEALELKGFPKPVPAYRIVSLKSVEEVADGR